MAVEGAARTLSAATPPVTVSCGIAVVCAGSSVREALSVADSAQYSAKRRGSLLFVAADPEPPTTRPRRRFRDRPPEEQDSPPLDAQLAVARAVVTLSHDLGDAPKGGRGRLVWLGEQLLSCFELDHWSLSTVPLDGERLLGVSSMGLRAGRSLEDAQTDLLVDTAFPLSDFPLTERAVLEGGWFSVDSHDDLADPAERGVLTALGKRYLVALGHREHDEGMLLELYGPAELDVELLGATTALAAGALFGRAWTRLQQATSGDS
jgi:hypothetical protein